MLFFLLACNPDPGETTQTIDYRDGTDGGTSSGERGSVKITEVLPESGLVYSEKGALSEVLSKPKIMPLKSVTLERIEEMERQAAQAAEFSRSVATAQRQEHQAQSSFPPPR